MSSIRQVIVGFCRVIYYGCCRDAIMD